MLIVQSPAQSSPLSPREKWKALLERTDYLNDIPDHVMWQWALANVERAVQAHNAIGHEITPRLQAGLEAKRRWLWGQGQDTDLTNSRTRIEAMIDKRWGLDARPTDDPEWNLYRATWHLLRCDRSGVDFTNHHAIDALVGDPDDKAGATREMWVQRGILSEMVEEHEAQLEYQRTQTLSHFHASLEEMLF